MSTITQYSLAFKQGKPDNSIVKKIALAMVIAILVFIGLPIQAAKAAEQECQTIVGIGVLCLTVSGGQATVSGPLGIGLGVDVPRIEVPVPGPTVYVNVPGPTIQVPGPSTTVTVTAAPPARATTTVTQTQRATETARVTAAPGENTTATVTQAPQTITATPTQTLAPTTATATERIGQAATPSDRVVTQEVETPGETVYKTVVKNAVLSVGLIIAGILLALLLIYLAYAKGREKEQRSINAFVQDLTDFTMSRKR